MSAKKFTSSGGEAKVTFTNGTTIVEKKPVYLKLKKIAKSDQRPLAGAVQVGPAAGIENDGGGGPDGPILYKRDALTNQGVGPATFKFSSVTNGVYEFTTDENGELEPIQWWDPASEEDGRYIKPGEYAVTEIVPPPGYESTTEVQQIKLELDENGNGIPAGPLVFQNLAKVGLKIIKYDRQSHRPMAGVTFEIYRDGLSIGRYETNASGEIILTNIAPGTYRAVEVDTGDDSHILDPNYQEVELTAGCGTKELFFFNNVLPGMKLVKIDSADPTRTIPGVKFRIEAVDGSYGPQEFTTDARGEIDLSKLPTGSYVVTELECPGYVVDGAQRIIHLRANDIAEFVFTNTKKPGLRLIKTSADGTPLDGVTFRIAKIEDGSRYLDRTTQNGGEILVEDLEPGMYSVQEIATLPDHILDETEHHVELFPGRTSEIRLKNDKRPTLIISKTDKDTGAPVPGVTFTLRGADGPTITTKPTGPDGKITITDLLPGPYTITEQNVPEGYILDTTPQTVTLFPNRETQVEFQNHQRPTLKIVKVDINGKHLTGAIFEVKTKAGVKIGDFPVNANGEIVVPQKHLAEGYYNCQDTIFGGFAPNSQTAEILSKALGNQTVQGGYIGKAKDGVNQSLQMMGRPLMTPDELKAIPKGSFVVMKTGTNPMRTRLRLFLDWGITFGDACQTPEHGQRKVYYADRVELETAIRKKYPPPSLETPVQPVPQAVRDKTRPSHRRVEGGSSQMRP